MWNLAGPLTQLIENINSISCLNLWHKNSFYSYSYEIVYERVINTQNVGDSANNGNCHNKSLSSALENMTNYEAQKSEA